MEKESDAQLIQRILSGNEAAFNVLVQRHQKSVHALAWRKIGDFHDAEEITQDTFLQVYKRLPTLKDPYKFAGWLYVIANRLCIDRMRQKNLRTQSLEDTPMEEVEQSSYAHHVSEQRQTEITERRRAIVKTLLEKLPESERTVMTLFYLGEMTVQEISKFLGVSASAIHNRLYRARKRLQEEEERLVQEVLNGVQIPASVSQNIMQRVADIKLTPQATPKPVIPWIAFGTAFLLLALLFGTSNQYLTRFQKPYSFEAASEPTITIIDTPVVLETDVKPALRNQAGQATAHKSRGIGSQGSETDATSAVLVSPEGPEAWMPDPALRTIVRETLAIPDDVSLTKFDMKRLTELHAEQRQITSLIGLEYATNLTEVLLGHNLISDVSPLANLVQLRALNMADCQISDLHPLSNLTRLESLRLHYNQIEDITPLGNLTTLTDLWLIGNQIADVRPLRNLTLLEELRIHNNAITDYSALDTLHLAIFAHDESCESSGLPIQERFQNRRFPSIFQAWSGILNRPALSHEARLAHHDLFWSPEFGLQFQRTEQGFQIVGNLSEARQQRDALLEGNPNMIVMLEMRIRDADPFSPFYRAAYGESFPWIRDAAGDKIPSSDEYTALRFIDFTHSDAQDIIIQQALAVKKCGFYDGIFFSGWSENAQVLNGYRTYEAEQEARLAILRRIRAEVGEDFLIIVNASGGKPVQAAPYINGIFFHREGDQISGYNHEALIHIESNLSWAEANLCAPQVNCLEGWGVGTEVPDSPTNLRLMRVFTAMGLTQSDGYVLYTTGIGRRLHAHDWKLFEISHKTEHDRGIAHNHDHDHYWYDFWDADLGASIGEKGQRYQNREGVFIREFSNGWAVYNRSGQAQHIRLPETTTAMASGITARSHTIPDLDGEIFLKK